jgi:hypothetical protein
MRSCPAHIQWYTVVYGGEAHVSSMYPKPSVQDLTEEQASQDYWDDLR